MFPHPYRIPVLIACLAATLAMGSAALGGGTLARQCAAVVFLAVAVRVALGPRSALRWSLTAALSLLAVAQLLTIRGYAEPPDPAGTWQLSLTRYQDDALALLPALLAFVVALLCVPRPRNRAVPAAIVAGVPLVLALTDVITDLDELAWTGPLLIGTWPALTALLVATAILFLTLQRAATSLWPVAGALVQSVLAAWTFTNAADIWSVAWRIDHSSAFIQSGVRIVTPPGFSAPAAILVAVTLGGPVLLAWGLLRRPAPGADD